MCHSLSTEPLLWIFLLCVNCLTNKDQIEMYSDGVREDHANASVAKDSGQHLLNIGSLSDHRPLGGCKFTSCAQESHASALAEERERGAAAAAQTAEQLASAQVRIAASDDSGQQLAPCSARWSYSVKSLY